jgi:transcriptional regulator with XRE-family HTH domain
MLPSAAQIRAARGLLGWSRAELASRARMSTKTVQQIEDGIVNPKASTLEALGLALMQGGALFLAPSGDGGEGVRRAPAKEE